LHPVIAKNMSKPWVSELSFDPDQVRTLLQALLPGLDLSTLFRLDQGWDNDIYLLDGELIFRLARRAIAIPLMRTEIRALPLLDGLLSFPIPRILHHGVFYKDFPFFSYPRLEGTIASELALGEAERETLVGPIADLLNELHALPLSAEWKEILAPDPFGRFDLVRRTEQIRNKISLAGELGAVFDPRLLKDLFPKLSPADAEQGHCIVHGDLYARNILIGGRTTLSGVIDWGDIHIGHPARDLAFALGFFGPKALGTFMERYKRSFDRTIFNLAVFSAINHTCYITEYAIDNRNERLAGECKTTFRHLQENYTTFHQS
jgi:aminoglycoside phosphotransferase (APT) family kinase protein